MSYLTTSLYSVNEATCISTNTSISEVAFDIEYALLINISTCITKHGKEH